MTLKQTLMAVLMACALAAAWTLSPAFSKPDPETQSEEQDSAEPQAEAPPPLKPATRDHPGAIRLVFFAVLEGLYLDGVRPDTVERMLMTDPETGEPLHFVPGCPLCMPAYDAIRLYRERPDFGLQYKGDQPCNTYGHGLDAATRNLLASDDWHVRLQAVRGLVQRWVAQRLETLRLTEAERNEWKQLMRDLADKGNAIMMEWSKRREQSYPGKFCAVCEGVAGFDDFLRPDGIED